MFAFRAENHGLLQLYRFRSAALEDKYLERSLKRRWYSCMIHFYLAIVFRLPLMLLSQSLTFRLLFTPILSCALVFLLLGHLSGAGRRWIVELHFVFCLLMASIDAYLFPQQVAESSALFYNLWLPSPQHHLVIVGPDGQQTVDMQFRLFVDVLVGLPILPDVLCTFLPSLLHIALNGLTPFLIPAFVAGMVSMALSVVLCPGIGTIFIVWHVLSTTVMTIFYFIIAIVVERWCRRHFLTETRLALELHTSQTADSILNHTLKNILSDAAATMELYLAGRVEQYSLESAIHCLRRGMRACKDRQVYLKLVAGEYAPALHTVALPDLSQDLIAGRDVQSHVAKLTVRTDVALLKLILENAVSNAFKHGHPHAPEVRFIATATSPSDGPGADGRRRLHFTVANVAHPQRPRLTPEVVASLFAGKAEGAAGLPVLSDRIGLTHCALAAEVGSITLNICQEGDVVTFCASVEADIVVDELDLHPVTPAACSLARTAVEPFPAGLRFAVLDDSRAARQLLQFHIASWCSPAVVRCFGEQEEDVEAFFTTATAEADIVILDQHLVYSQSYLGTDIVQRLTEAGFSGFICLRSANDTVEDQALYMRSGAHCSFGKDLPGKQLMAELKDAYCLFKASPGIAPPQPERQHTHLTVELPEPPPRRRSARRRSSAVYSQIISVPDNPCTPTHAWTVSRLRDPLPTSCLE